MNATNAGALMVDCSYERQQTNKQKCENFITR